MPPFTVSRLFVLLAAACFLLATFSVAFPVVALVPLGLTLVCVSHLVP